jgi:hypothetical protein
VNRLIGRIIVLFAALMGAVTLVSNTSVWSAQTAEVIWPNNPVDTGSSSLLPD